MIKKLVINIKKAIRYITYDIWVKKEQDYKSPKVRWAVRQIKLLLYTGKGLGQHDILTRSAALTFYTAMSVVPIAALVFGISKGFGLEEKLNEYLYSEFDDYTALIDRILQFANAMLQRTKGGILAAAGVLVLFWSVMKVFSNIEDALNKIWDVRKSRSLGRKLTDYLSIVTLVPLMWLISNLIIFQLKNQILNISLSWISEIFFRLLSWVIIWIMFAILYKVMPNTRVKTINAVKAGIVAGTIFQLFQIIYLYIQSGVSNYNAIYGSFAAVPLFLIWLQTSWQIVLVGAELSFSYQNIKNYEYEKLAASMSHDYKRKIDIVVMQEIVKYYTKKSGPVTSEIIADELNLPVRIVRDAIFDLEKADLIISTQSNDGRVNYYKPAHDANKITVYDVIKRVETSGKKSLELEESEELRNIEKIVDKFNDMVYESNSNKLLVDLNDNNTSQDSVTRKNLRKKKNETKNSDNR